MKINQTEVTHYGRTTVVNYPHPSVDPYGLLDHADNVEKEGLDSYRFDGVNPKTRKSLEKILIEGVSVDHNAFIE